MDEERATAALDETGIDYTLVRHGPVSSLAEAAQLRGVHPGQVVKTLVVRRSDGDYLFVRVPGDRQISWPQRHAPPRQRPRAGYACRPALGDTLDVRCVSRPGRLMVMPPALRKAALTILATGILLLYLSTLRLLGDAARSPSLVGEQLLLPSWSPVLHASGAIAVLLIAAVLSVFKPKGLTRRGWRKQQEHRGDREAPTSTDQPTSS